MVFSTINQSVSFKAVKRSRNTLKILFDIFLNDVQPRLKQCHSSEKAQLTKLYESPDATI